MFGENAIVIPNPWTRVEGKDAIAAIMRSGADAIFRLRDLTQSAIGVAGSLAYTVNSYSYTYHREGDAPHWHKTKNVHIWKRDPEGNWKLHVDIWSSDVPISESQNE